MDEWLRKAEVSVLRQKALTCLIRGTKEQKVPLRPRDSMSEYIQSVTLTHINGYHPLGQPSRLFPANYRPEMKMQSDKPLPCGVFSKGLGTSHTDRTEFYHRLHRKCLVV